jgi:hypothetical protein
MATVSAVGGYGKNQGLGGAGGVIVIDAPIGLEHTKNFKFSGGDAGPTFQEENGCGVGAAGTLYFKQNDYLLVDNGGMKTSRSTSADMKRRADGTYKDRFMATETVII